jgi:hypothetical protein
MNKNLSDPTICYICIERFSILNKPMILMCGHTLCERCLKIIWNKKKEIQCSYCKSVTSADKIDDIIVNYSVLNSIEYINSLSTDKQIIQKIDSNNDHHKKDLSIIKNSSTILNSKLSSAISKFTLHNCNNKDNVHFSDDKLLTLKICLSCYSIHCNECYVTYQQEEGEITLISKCVYCEYLHFSKKEYNFDGEKLNISNKKIDKKAATKQGNKYIIESKTRIGKDGTLEDYDTFISNNFESFKSIELEKFNELNTLYNQYMLNSNEQSLKDLLEDEINKAKKKFSDLIIRLKKEEEHSILRMNMTFERKIQDFYVLAKEQKGLLNDTQRFCNVINENYNYRNFPIRQKITSNRIFNFPLLIHEIKEFSNEAEARIEAFKEVSSFKTHFNKASSKEVSEGLFMIELRENLSNCVRLSNFC